MWETSSFCAVAFHIDFLELAGGAAHDRLSGVVVYRPDSTSARGRLRFVAMCSVHVDCIFGLVSVNLSLERLLHGLNTVFVVAIPDGSSDAENLADLAESTSELHSSQLTTACVSPSLQLLSAFLL
jgi:hypothetical protein